MTVDDKILEKKLLIRRVYPETAIYAIGKENGIPYFDQFVHSWEADPDEAAMELAQALSEKQLQEVSKKHLGRSWTVFRGIHYTFEDGTLSLKGSVEKIRAGIAETEKKYGQDCIRILKAMAQAGGSFGQKEFKDALKQKIDPYPILLKLEQLKVVVSSHQGEDYNEWKILEETLPLIRDELGIPNIERTPVTATTRTTGTSPVAPSSSQQTEEKIDPLADERQKLQEMQNDILQMSSIY